jgi:hypothetical protein
MTMDTKKIKFRDVIYELYDLISFLEKYDIEYRNSDENIILPLLSDEYCISFILSEQEDSDDPGFSTIESPDQLYASNKSFDNWIDALIFYIKNSKGSKNRRRKSSSTDIIRESSLLGLIEEHKTSRKYPWGKQ